MIWRQLSLIILCFLLSACINFKPNGQPIKKYTLDYDATHLPQAKFKQNKVILINTGQATPGLESNKMLYQQHDFEMQYYAYHQWVAPPADLIIPLVTQALNKGHGFDAVVNAPIYAGMADEAVTFELLHLEQHFQGNASIEMLELKMVVVDLHTNRVATTQNFVVSVPAEPNAEGEVKATNIALAQLIPKIVHNLQEVR